MAPSRRTTAATLTCLLGTGLLVPALAVGASARPAETAPVPGVTQAAAQPGGSLARALAATPAAAAGSTESVSLQLTPRDPAGLAALAQESHHLTRATRLARLDTVIAGAGRARQVGQVLTGLGLTVTASNDFTVTARGPKSRVDALFGSARGHDARLATAQTLPSMPAGLAGLVTAGWGGDDSRPAVLPHSVTSAPAVAPRSHASAPTDGSLSVAQARSQYGVVATTAPPAQNGPIVATLQFYGSTGETDDPDKTPAQNFWPTGASDLDTFGSTNGIYPSSYAASSGVSTTLVPESCTLSPEPTGNVEAALDQETLLTVAPQLRQRMYLAPNCGNAQDDAIGQLVTDVGNGAPIMALSTSWGSCEEGSYTSGSARSFDPQAAAVSADLDAVNAAVAAGVTVFAASGDQGAYDCLDTDGHILGEDAVDTPAVVPGVVGVGGTSGTGTLSVWRDGSYASGGGFSCDVFQRPAFQSAFPRTSYFPHNGNGCTPGRPDRQVPDMAADAGGGLDTICTGCNSGYPDLQSTGRIFGTSFAAPLAAGGMAQTLVDLGTTTGIGSVTSLLYTYGGVKGILTGTNGEYPATAGYDVTTGVGSPIWPAILAGSSGTNLEAATVGAGGLVSVQGAQATTQWHSPTAAIRTALQLDDPADWQLLFAPFGGDGANDLWAIHLTGTDSGQVEAHVLSEASGYQQYVAHFATAFGAIDPTEVQMRVAGFGGDNASDLFLVQTHGTTSGRVELHVLSAASNLHTFVAHRATALPAVTGGWTFLIGGRTGGADLYAVRTDTSPTQEHILSAASSYHVFTGHFGTVLGALPTDGSVQLSLADINHDGQSDLVEVVTAGTASGRTEMHALAGPTAHTYVAHYATGLPTQPLSATVRLPG